MNIKRLIKFWWQRVTRGWDDSETWNLDRSLAKLILPRLKRYKEISIAFPADLTEVQWNEYLDKMIFSFEFSASKHGDYSGSDDEYEKYQEGLDLFAEYYTMLWW